jgi:hypothetical protein
MNKMRFILSICLLAAAAAQAGTINFAALNNALEGNTLNVGGVSDNLVVSGAADGNNYLYIVTYTGADYDGDTVNDTLSFEVLVQGWTGSSASVSLLGSDTEVDGNNGSATIGTTDSDVVFGTKGWSVDNGVMSAGKTLEFSFQNFLISGTTSVETYSASLSGFQSVTYAETSSSYGHVAVIGQGTGLVESRFNSGNPGTYTTTADLPGDNPLYITSAALGDLPSSNAQRWNMQDVDFGVDVNVIPEPAALTLVGLTGLGFMWIKRRFS